MTTGKNAADQQQVLIETLWNVKEFIDNSDPDTIQY